MGSLASCHEESIFTLVEFRILGEMKFWKFKNVLVGLSARKGMALSSAPAKVSMAAFEAPFSFASSERLRGLKGQCQEIYWANVSSLAVFRRLLEAPCKVGLATKLVPVCLLWLVCVDHYFSW
jgi:hypothetical protein